jgi:hypothetical protein
MLPMRAGLTEHTRHLLIAAALLFVAGMLWWGAGTFFHMPLYGAGQHVD